MARPVRQFTPLWFDSHFKKELKRLPKPQHHVPRVPPVVRLCEYRCSYPMRVIARWIEPSETEPEGSVLLVAATLSHDHGRLKEIIGSHRSDL